MDRRLRVGVEANGSLGTVHRREAVVGRMRLAVIGSRRVGRMGRVRTY